MDFMTKLLSYVASILLLSASPTHTEHQTNKKKWTVIIYIAADNNLRRFVANNIKQMATIGSNENLNLCVELHMVISGKKVVRRYYIEKDNVVHINADEADIEDVDSGDPQTLVTCCNHFISRYPAQEYALILWNHGLGVIDPLNAGRPLNTLELFTYNPTIKKLELDRSMSFLDIIGAQQDEQRGVCWDDTTGNYLTNHQLDAALQAVRTNSLAGEKFSIIGFDACFMQMAEIANIVKKHAHIMVGSQEVELALGWDYKNALQSFVNGAPDKYQFARDMVTSYDQFFANLTNDYTLSAIDLSHMAALEQNIHAVATLLVQGLKKQEGSSVLDIIRASRDKYQCTHFYEPAYIDLHHFYCNLCERLEASKLAYGHDEKGWKEALYKALEDGCTLIDTAIFANVTGKNLTQARGVSIYFPETARRIHQSYRTTDFASTNEWMTFLMQHNYRLM